jgi:hypothetical protein
MFGFKGARGARPDLQAAGLRSRSCPLRLGVNSLLNTAGIAVKPSAQIDGIADQRQVRLAVAHIQAYPVSLAIHAPRKFERLRG